MVDKLQDTRSLKPQELEAVYAISRTIARTPDTEAALDEIITLVRPVYIFDNMVLYLPTSEGNLETVFARAIGRGRFLEADLSWGESVAEEVFASQKIVKRLERLRGKPEDRTQQRYFLGLPLILAEEVLGVIIFVRFGGPEYTEDQIHLAEYIAVHIGQLLGHQKLVSKVADLEARRRLDSLQDDFVATISHELLTPLGFIKGYATTLLRDDTNWDEETRREFLAIIDEEADRLRDLIDNLMDSSRLQSGTLQINLQPLRMETLLRDIALRAATRDDSMRIDLQLNAPGVQIEGDPTRLAQVFENLLNNAAKYAPNSPVTIRLRRVDENLRITVEDRGPGISPEHLQRLFQRFYRVPNKNSSVRGTGLGLYICRQIIQAHHGEINVESIPGEGTSFHIFLPIPETLSKSRKPAKATAPDR